jgi:hypothetical protein
MNGRFIFGKGLVSLARRPHNQQSDGAVRFGMAKRSK